MSPVAEASQALCTDAQQKQFREQGYLIIKPGFPEEFLDRLADFTQHFDYPSEETRAIKEDQSLSYGTRVQDAWRFNDAVKEMALYPAVIDVIQVLYQKRPRPFQTLNFPVGTQQGIHSDVVHFNCWPTDGSMCGAWVALEDTDEENGALTYYPGSHLLPELFHINFGIPAGKAHYREYEIALADFIKRCGLKAEAAHMKRGEVILWAANLLHGGLIVKDHARTRLSQATHYFFEGKYSFWTPHESDIQEGYIMRREIEEIGVAPEPTHRPPSTSATDKPPGASTSRIRKWLKKLLK